MYLLLLLLLFVLLLLLLLMLQTALSGRSRRGSRSRIWQFRDIEMLLRRGEWNIKA